MNREMELCEKVVELCEQGGGAVVNREVELCELGGGAE